MKAQRKIIDKWMEIQLNNEDWSRYLEIVQVCITEWDLSG